MDAFRDAKVIVKRFDFKFSSAGWAFSNRHQLNANSYQEVLTEPFCFLIEMQNAALCFCSLTKQKKKKTDFVRHHVEFTSKADANGCCFEYIFAFLLASPFSGQCCCLFTMRFPQWRERGLWKPQALQIEGLQLSGRSCKQQESISCLSRASSRGYKALLECSKLCWCDSLHYESLSIFFFSFKSTVIKQRAAVDAYPESGETTFFFYFSGSIISRKLRGKTSIQILIGTERSSTISYDVRIITAKPEVSYRHRCQQSGAVH